MKESFARIDDFGKSLAYLESGRVKVDEIVSDEFALRTGSARWRALGSAVRSSRS